VTDANRHIGQPKPVELRVSADRRTLTIAFANGASHEIPAELLRVRSPSADVRGHGAADAKLVSGKRHVTIADIFPVGNYAIRIAFADGHSTGIYRWAYLEELGAGAETHMRNYEQELQRAGKSRDDPL
jgi:DUF971 family protein